MISDLIKLADQLDSAGLYKYANIVDDTLVSLSQQFTTVSAKELESVKPDIMDAVKDAIVFDLILDVDSHGDGNILKAIPRIHDKWTDGLMLGEANKIPGIGKFFQR